MKLAQTNFVKSDANRIFESDVQEWHGLLTRLARLGSSKCANVPINLSDHLSRRCKCIGVIMFDIQTMYCTYIQQRPNENVRSLTNYQRLKQKGTGYRSFAHFALSRIN